MDINNTAQLGSLARAASATRSESPGRTSGASSATETVLQSTQTVVPNKKGQEASGAHGKKYGAGKAPSGGRGASVDIYV